MTGLLMESVPTDWSPWLIAGVGAAALVLLIIVMRPAARRAEAQDESLTSDDDAGESRNDGKKASGAQPQQQQARGVEREMSQLMTEISEMARQVGAQLDARSSKLERLMREADERIAKMQALHAAAAEAAKLPKPQAAP